MRRAWPRPVIFYCSKLCLQALRTGRAFSAVDAAGGILRHVRPNRQAINVLHRCVPVFEGLFLSHCPRRGLLWTFYKMWEDNGCSLRGNDFQRTMQQLEELMMGGGFDALMATG